MLLASTLSFFMTLAGGMSVTSLHAMGRSFTGSASRMSLRWSEAPRLASAPHPTPGSSMTPIRPPRAQSPRRPDRLCWRALPGCNFRVPLLAKPTSPAKTASGCSSEAAKYVPSQTKSSFGSRMIFGYLS